MLKLFRLATPFRRQMALVLVLALAQSFGNLYLPRLMSEVVDRGIVTGDTSAIIQNGIDHLATVRAELDAWLDSHAYGGVKDILGCMSNVQMGDSAALERAKAQAGTPANTDALTPEQQAEVAAIEARRAEIRELAKPHLPNDD